MPRRSTLLRCAVLAATAQVVLATWMFWGAGLSLHEMKSYFGNDQESYLAIAVNLAHGDFRSVEPFTQTGSIYYPRLYYQALGLVAYVTRVDPVVLWWVCALAFQALLVGTVSAVCVGFTGRRWMTVLGPLVATAGVFGVYAGGGWLVDLPAHAVLWGTFAELFTGNGESVAVTVVALSLIGLVGVVSGRVTGRRAWLLSVTVALALGMTASVHTYTFLTGVYAVGYTVAFHGLIRGRGRARPLAVVASGALLAGLFLVGPGLADVAGPLVLLVAGLLPAAPGVLLAALRDRRLCVGVLLVGVGAAPQVVLTAAGVAVGDPFLVYRQASSGDTGLGVPLGSGLLHGLLLVLLVLLVLAAGVATRHPWWTAIALGSGTGWLLLWTNDRWGADQEPYRLWLNGFTLLLPVLVVVGAWIRSELDTRWSRVAAAGMVALACFSLLDYVQFSRDRGVDDLTSYDTAQLDAVARATAPVPRDRGESLVLAGPCIEPRALKIRTGLAVAYENVGLAWAREHDALVALVPDMWRGHSPAPQDGLDVAAARAAQVRFVVSDSSCEEGVFESPALHPVRTVGYTTTGGTTARITLSRLD